MSAEKQKYDELLREFEAFKKQNTLLLTKKNTELDQLKQALQKSNRAIDAMPVGIVIYDADGKIKKYNKHFTKLFGYTIEDVPNLKDWFPLAYPDLNYRTEVSKKWFDAIEMYHKTKKFTPIEAEVRCKDNSYKTIEFRFEASGDNFLTTFVDLSEQKKAIKNLLKAEEFNESLINSLPAIFYVYELSDKDARLIKWNKNHEGIMGYSKESLYGKSIFDFFNENERELLLNTLKALESKKIVKIEANLKYGDGRTHPYFFTATLFCDNNRKFFHGIGLDFSDLKKTEQALSNSIKKYRTLFNAANDAIFTLNSKNLFLDCNYQAMNMLGYTSDKIIGKTPADFFPKKLRSINDSVKEMVRINELALKGTPQQYEWVIEQKNKELLPVEVSLSRYRLDKEFYLHAIVRDISDRKKNELALVENEEKYRLLFESANDAIFLMDYDKFIDCNEQTLKMFACKREDIIGKAPYHFSPKLQPDGSKSKDRAKELIAKSLQKKINTFEWQHKKLDGTLFYAEVSLNAIKINNKVFIQAIVRDINDRMLSQIELEKYKNRLEDLVKERTEDLQKLNESLQSANKELSAGKEQIENQKQDLISTLNNLKETQIQLVQSEKMASLGILTAGVAHEINNPLNYIQGGIYSLENLLEEVEKKEAKEIFVKVLKHMQTGIDRVSTILTGLNSFSKMDDEKKLPCNIHKIINNCLSILNYEIKDKYEIELNFEKKEIFILASESKLHQAFTNILLNSIHALGPKGKIIIRTKISQKNNKFEITIHDNGVGITPIDLEKIYDPFFTTKDPGQGIGLGLATVYQIIKEHNGKIEYTSIQNKGTKVSISLPIK